jgi:hypothetical protein
MNLVLIETSGNQAYIFATNKLRENVGASELTYRVGTQFVHDALSESGGPDVKRGSQAEVRLALRDGRSNPSIESGLFTAEVILAASGKALLLVANEERGRAIVRGVSRRVVELAPGIEAPGVIGGDFDAGGKSIHDAIREAHRLLENARSAIPGPAQRHLRLPVVADCLTSGLPAAGYATHGLPKEDHGPRSAVALAKQDAREHWHERVESICKQNGVSRPLPDATTELEKLGCDWVAVVHADGNGLGQVFLDFNKSLSPSFQDDPKTHSRNYIDELRRFSLALEECTEQAFCDALTVLQPVGRRDILPIVPLVLGGDDLTVVCDGRQAMPFIREFIRAFEMQTRSDPTIRSVMTRVKSQDCVTSCAGVAIVKPHFPFFSAYSLAEELLMSAKALAKQGATPISAVDFHVLYDASAPDLDRIRKSLTVDEGKTRLFARPYAVSLNQGPPNRCVDDLLRRLKSIQVTEDDGRRLLPNSMLHELREGLFLGRHEADARLQLAMGRHDPGTFGNLINTPSGMRPSLFWDGDGGVSYTALLDTMDLAEFWKEVDH